MQPKQQRALTKTNSQAKQRCRKESLLYLKTGVELQKAVRVGTRREEVLDSAGAHVANELPKTHSSLLHPVKHIGWARSSRTLLDDLLVSPLHRAVATVQRNALAVLVGKKLHLEVTSPAGQLHDEDGRPGHL
jgi:hypothetical protein